ncbi:MAG: hypothetical protein ABIK65_04720 [Candidatus Eisenbacteria bacterium]
MIRPFRRPLLLALLPLLLVVSAGGAQVMDAIDLIDTPTATAMPHAAYDTGLRLYSGGGVLFRLRVGLRDAVHFGFSFGGTNLLGTGDPDWNPRVEFIFRGLLIRESYAGPAVALGYDSQGYGFWDSENGRYQVKSRGFYAVASKHFVFLGDLGLHGGVNYSLEREDDDEEVNFFFGLEKSIHPSLDLLLEYDAAVNDNADNGVFGEGKGYLNAALLWRVSDALALEADFRNLLENGESFDDFEWNPGEWSRELKIVYTDYF